MQRRALHKSKHFFFYCAKYLIPGIALFTIHHQLIKMYNKEQILFSQLYEQGSELIIIISILMLLMSCANWFLEGKKWQLSVSATCPINFYTAMRQCLIGATSSLLTPAKAGDYVAKPLFYPPEYRSKILGLNTLNHLCQMSVTGVFGLLSLAILGSYMPAVTELIDLRYIFIPITFVVLLMLAAFLFLKRNSHKSYLKLKNTCKVASNELCFYLLGLSVIRYLVFTFQFIFLLVLFGADIDFGLAFVLLSAIHLINSSLPTPALSDAVVKGSLGVLLFGLFGVNAWMVLLATALMWLFNQAIPVLLGAYYLARYKRKNLA